MAFKTKEFLRKLLRWSGIFALWFFIITVFWVVCLRFINPPVTWLMISRYFIEDYGLKKDWVDIEECSPEFPLAVIAAEDQNFFNHSGFDFAAIEKALEQNQKKSKKKKVKGASTISQQTAKNVFLWPSRSWVRKGFEVYFTGLIELFWGKKRILEVYINVVETGKGIYGIEQASQQYFNKPSSKLNRQQAALIAAILPSPTKYSASKPSGYISGRKQWISSQMNNLGGVSFLNEILPEEK